MKVMGEIPRLPGDRFRVIHGYTDGVALSGQVTITGRTSGETVKAPKGQISVRAGIISQAKGQRSVKQLGSVCIRIQRSNHLDLAFSIGNSMAHDVGKPTEI